MRSPRAQRFDSEKRGATKTGPWAPGMASGKGALGAHVTPLGERGGTKFTVLATRTRRKEEQRAEEACGRPVGGEAVRRGCSGRWGDRTKEEKLLQQPEDHENGSPKPSG